MGLYLSHSSRKKASAPSFAFNKSYKRYVLSNKKLNPGACKTAGTREMKSCYSPSLPTRAVLAHIPPCLFRTPACPHCLNLWLSVLARSDAQPQRTLVDRGRAGRTALPLRDRPW